MSPFIWNTGKPSALNTAKERQNAQRAVTQTANVERRRAEGADIGVFLGISKKADEQHTQWRARNRGKK